VRQFPLLADNVIFGCGGCDTISKKASGRYKIQGTRYKVQNTRYKVQDTRYKVQALHSIFHLTFPPVCFIALVSKVDVSCTNLFSMYGSSSQFQLYLFLLFSVQCSVIFITVPFPLIHLLLFLFLSPFTFWFSSFSLPPFQKITTPRKRVS
jgi:hypothetical protein